MVARYAIAALIAGAMTFGIFFGMQTLISNDSVELAEKKPSWQIDFVRLKRDETVNRKERKKPEKVDRPEPPPPAAPAAESETADVEFDIPLFDAALTLGDGPALGMGGDSGVVPMVRVNPQYPPRAASRGIEGWVHLRFTVTALGSTDDIQVVEADPRGYFETAAKSAVKRYKYKPRVEDGVAVPTEGVEVLLSFKLEK
jgi:protein TonB